MTKKAAVKLTANFERNLVDIERFLTEADAASAYDSLLDELLGTVIPNLERFPSMGRSFFSRVARSVETTTALEQLQGKLLALTPDPEALREYIMDHYLVLYAQTDGNIHLLAIKHHRQLSFDFVSQWRTT